MRIAIIGGGFSGMLAAYLLEKKGHKVTVYEKEEQIGGHCRTLVNKDLYVELGTVFSFSAHIKELLLELDISYSERFTYRNFVDEKYEKVEHLSHKEVSLMIEELARLEKLLSHYCPEAKCLNYGAFHEDLLLPLDDFLKYHHLTTISQVIAPHLSSYGFGQMNALQAYYAFNVFNLSTIYAFIRGEKLLFVDEGVSQVIFKLSQNISDIRYSAEVKGIAPSDNQVMIETDFENDFYDKVLITTKLPSGVIKEPLYDDIMKKIETHPYFTCAYEVKDKNIVTTYYKAHLGEKEKIQFFHTYKQKDKTILVAYAYGTMNAGLVNEITEDIKRTGIEVKHLITAKQWYIFPHLNLAHLTPTFYADIEALQSQGNIYFIGSLISKPSFSNLYESVKQFIEKIF